MCLTYDFFGFQGRFRNINTKVLHQQRSIWRRLLYEITAETQTTLLYSFFFLSFFLPLETFSWVAVLRSWMSLPLNNVWFPNASYFMSVNTVDIPLLWTMLMTGQGREFACCRKLLHWRWMSRTLKIDGTALHAAECPHNNDTARSSAASEATWTEKIVNRWR